jgi:chromosome segregation ATPase
LFSPLPGRVKEEINMGWYHDEYVKDLEQTVVSLRRQRDEPSKPCDQCTYLEDAVRASSSVINKLDREVHGLKAERDEALDEAAQLQEDVERLERELDRAEVVKNGLRNLRALAAEEVGRLQEEVEHLQAARAEALADVERLKRKIGYKDEELADVRSRRDTLSHSTAVAELKLIQIREVLDR